MNERIRELAKDCGYQHIPLTSLDKVGDFDYFDIERFAELIVKECITIAKNERYNMQFLASNPPQSAAAYDIEQKIKKHFGVEE